MRDYRFRGKSIEPLVSVDQWVYGFGVSVVKLTSGKSQCWMYTDGGVYEVDPETVGQIFPFKDSEESELYPGDIIKTIHTRASEDVSSDDPFSNTAPGYEEYEKIGFLEYYQGYNYGPRLRWKKGHMMIPNTSTLWRMKAVKIGNRFDNPDLLGEVRE